MGVAGSRDPPEILRDHQHESVQFRHGEVQLWRPTCTLGGRGMEVDGLTAVGSKQRLACPPWCPSCSKMESARVLGVWRGSMRGAICEPGEQVGNWPGPQVKCSASLQGTRTRPQQEVSWFSSQNSQGPKVSSTPSPSSEHAQNTRPGIQAAGVLALKEKRKKGGKRARQA